MSSNDPSHRGLIENLAFCDLGDQAYGIHPQFKNVNVEDGSVSNDTSFQLFKPSPLDPVQGET